MHYFMLSLDVLEGSLRSWRFYWRDGKIRERLSRERAGAIGVFLVAAHFVKLASREQYRQLHRLIRRLRSIYCQFSAQTGSYSF